MHGAVLARRFLVFGFLQIVRKDERGDAPFRDRDAHCPVDEMAHLRRHHCLLDEFAGDILEHVGDVDLLLVLPADRRARLLAGDRQHGHLVEPRVIKAGDEM